MNKILELSDSYGCQHPLHFQVFLDNCLKTYEENFIANDYLFAAVYFLILETGFTPVEPADTFNDSINFDFRNISQVLSYTENQIKISNKLDKPKYFVYQIFLKLGGFSSNVCELQGVPSGEINTHLIINFLSKEPHVVKSLCLNTDLYVDKSDNPDVEHKYSLKNLKELSILVKNKIAIQIKDVILINEEEGCCGNLFCLPEEIQKKIVYLLINDSTSITNLSSTCTYFYNFITKDSKLWEEICFQEYDGWVLNKALHDSTVSGDTNVFRTAFLNLKAKGFIRSIKQ